MKRKKHALQLSLFNPDSSLFFSDVHCQLCASNNQVLFKLGKTKKETFGSFRYLCVSCRGNLI